MEIYTACSSVHKTNKDYSLAFDIVDTIFLNFHNAAIYSYLNHFNSIHVRRMLNKYSRQNYFRVYVAAK